MNDYQKKQREKTIAAVTEAAEHLQEKGVTLTFRAIADEADLSHSTVLQPGIKSYLYKKFPIGKQKSSTQQDAALRAKIEELKKKLADSRRVNSNLRKECKLLKEQRDKTDLDYRHLLFKYAINIDKTITSI